MVVLFRRLVHNSTVEVAGYTGHVCRCGRFLGECGFFTTLSPMFVYPLLAVTSLKPGCDLFKLAMPLSVYAAICIA